MPGRSRHEIPVDPRLAEVEEREPGMSQYGTLPRRGLMVEPEIACDRWLTKSPGVVTHGTSSNVVTLEWQLNAFIVYLAGSTKGVNSDVSLSSVGLQMQLLQDTRELMTDDSSAAFVLYSDLFGRAPGSKLYTARKVCIGQKWNLLWRNDHASVDYTPTLTFHLRQCFDG